MGPASVRVIQYYHIAFVKIVLKCIHCRVDAVVHGRQMHRHVGRLSYQVGLIIEQHIGKVHLVVHDRRKRYLLQRL